MYTYQITVEPVMAKVFYDENIVDNVGPWESIEAAQNWVESYVNKLNLGV
jgi:hypothetical protein